MSNTITAVEIAFVDDPSTVSSFSLLLLGLETSRDSESQHAPNRNEQYSRQLITFPILHGISIWEFPAKLFSPILTMVTAKLMIFVLWAPAR